MKRTCKALLSWCFALAIAAACANLITFFYRSGSGSIPRTNAFSNNIRTPNSRLVRGTEGYGVNFVDENGYVNDDSLPLIRDYILFMGSSHAEGLQVMQSRNMVTVLNGLFSANTRTVYNMGTAGYTLPLIIEGFQAGIDEFPHSSAIIIELSEMACTSDELTRALDQTQYAPSSSGAELVKSQSLSRRVRNDLLSVFPIISLLRQQIDSASFNFHGAFGLQAMKPAQTTQVREINIATAAPAESADFLSALNQAFALLRSEYDNPIVLLYHPGVYFLPDGTLTVNRETQFYDDYVSACKSNGFTFVDTGDAFLEAYESDFTVPYGFQNSTLCSGHLNVSGHRIVAEELYQALNAALDKESR